MWTFDTSFVFSEHFRCHFLIFRSILLVHYILVSKDINGNLGHLGPADGAALLHFSSLGAVPAPMDTDAMNFRKV